MISLEEEHKLGKLCEEGFLKERYDEEVGELVRTTTIKGIQKIKELLNDKEYKKFFIDTTKEMLKDMPDNIKLEVLNKIAEKLKNV